MPDFEFPDDSDTGEEASESQIAQLRKRADKASEYEKELKQLRKEREELVRFQAETVEKEKRGTLRDAGLTDGQARAFLKMYEEVTPEYIGQFRAEVLGIEVAPEPEQEAPQTENVGFGPAGSSNPLPAKVYSNAEWLALSLNDPALGRRLLEEGRVDRTGLRVGLGRDYDEI